MLFGLIFGRKPNQHDDMEERPSFEGHKLTTVSFTHLENADVVGDVFGWHINQVI